MCVARRHLQRLVTQNVLDDKQRCPAKHELRPDGMAELVPCHSTDSRAVACRKEMSAGVVWAKKVAGA
jgi:hypothetical protein